MRFTSARYGLVIVFGDQLAHNEQMSAVQIASVVQYVRQHFAGIDTPITAEPTPLSL